MMKKLPAKVKAAPSDNMNAQKSTHFLFRHPLILPVVVFMILFFFGLVLYVSLGGQTVGASDKRIVQVYYDNKDQTVPTRAKTVGDLLQRLNIPVGTKDVVEPAIDTAIVEDNFKVNVYRARPVTILDGLQKTHVLSAAASGRTVAAQAGVKTYAEDIVSREPIDDVARDGIGDKVVINRATPALVNLYGTALTVRTHVKTVGELLKEKNVVLAKDDTIQPSVDTLLTNNIQIFVVRFGSQVATVEEAIAPPSQTVEDTNLSFGTTVTRQAGVPGKRVVTYQISLQNGKEVSRSEIQNVVEQAPVPTIIARGQAISIPDDKTSLMANAGIPAADFAYVNYIVSRESGWCPTKWQGQVGYCPAYYSDVHSTDSGYGFGLCQSTPAGKMSSAGSDWQTNPVTQLKWCSGYAVGRYGSWYAAYNHWAAYNNW